MKVEFVDSQKAEHGVQPVLRALQDTPAQIAPSTYYAAKTRPASFRSRRDEELAVMIERIHAANYGVYGPARSGTSCTARVSRWPGAPSNG